MNDAKATKTSVISFVNVSRSYTRGGETLHALEDFSLEVPEGSFQAIMGPSGSGKSTFPNLCGGLDQPSAGQVIIGGEDLSHLTKPELASFRADNIGFIFQGFNLLPVLTAVQNVELPLKLTPLTSRQRREQAEFALEIVGLKDRMHHRPSELSGGQEQRVAIARALATDPRLILADEPTGDLDRETADAVLDLLVRLNREHGKSIIMVTHDPRAAVRAEATIHLDKGRLGKIVYNGGDEVADGIQTDDEPAADAGAETGAPAESGDKAGDKTGDGEG